MRILIAGGAGYVGSRLVPALRERGYDVTVVDRLWFGNHLPADVPVHAVDANAAWARPGTRLVDGVEELAGILHPRQPRP